MSTERTANGLKLSEIYNQNHITAVLRAAVIKGEIASVYVFAGGTPDERRQISEAFHHSVRCYNAAANKGDPCGQCFNCQNNMGVRVGHTAILADDLGDVDPDLLSTAVVFELNAPQIDQEPVYFAATALLLVVMRKGVSDVLSATQEFVETYSYRELTDTLLFVLRDALAVKYGAEQADPNKGIRYIAHTLTQYLFVQCMQRLWEAQTKNVTNEVALGQALTVMLADTISPSLPKPIETPINDIEEPAPLSFADMLSWVKES